MKQSAAKQTLKITAVNGVVRALGMLLRILLSRLLGAEIMGIAELSQSVHMLAITPLTSGLPLAVSRMTAKARTGGPHKAPAGRALAGAHSGARAHASDASFFAADWRS